MQPELEALLAIQDKDLEILEVERKIEHHKRRRQQIQQQLNQATERHEKIHADLEEKKIEGRKLSEEVDHLDDHIREQERKLAEDIVSFKEIDIIKESIEHGHQHISDLEEKALALLDEIEVDEDTTKEKDDTYAQQKSKFDADIAEKEKEIATQEDTKSGLQKELDDLWAALPSHLKATYERLKKNFSDPLARLQGVKCSGCQLQLSSQMVQDVKSAMSLVHCEHCSRILYQR